MKKNYLMEIIREEISSYLGENEPMYDSPQTQQREVNTMLDQVENLKRLRADLDEQIAQLETIANTFNVNELAFEVTGKNKKTVTSFKDKSTADAFARDNQVKVTPLEEDQNNILISSNLIRSYITELIYYSEDMEYTPEMIKKLKDLKGGLSGGKISIEDALDVVQQTIDITGDEIDAIEALGQAVDYDDNIINAARDIKGLNENNQLDEETLNETPFIDGPQGVELFSAIKTASERLKNQFPEATPEDIAKIIKNKKTQTQYAPEVKDELTAQFKKYGGGKFTPELGPDQTLKAVAKALGEYEPGPRGPKAKEKPAAAKAAPAAKSAPAKAEPKAKMEPEDKADAAAMKAAAKSKGGSSRAEKYGMLRNKLERVTAELKSLAGSPDMDTRKKLTADKMRIEMAMDKLKQIAI